MNSHQRNTGSIIISLTIQVGQQGYILQIISQKDLFCPILFLAFLHKRLHTTQELLQVFLTGNIVCVLTAIKDFCTDTTFLDNSLTKFIDIHLISSFNKATDKKTEFIQLSKRTLVDS